ncbi:UDP-2,3-diacylglucosamine diphosphatase [Corallincola luteus]|uniref:UDP-2,3-diacylglucosamine diphosphatase n=2 Tax=Corallincola TaxID=1775176 RepID=A0A368N5C4_9GAMM|nr:MULTISPECIES: UDP-2,3-diacylglucosamine diphosphatase [Corallincola]RCU45742.1 UDP-2,3-diacylglucosamine diphosphatase [Corallincola holothuriorum]TCI02144.1 UDP-2,3-diacylglucosamine diphosphatase [Corallincola luteus]
MTTRTVLHHYRAIWLSDIHLGSRDCQASYLLSFLRSMKTDTLFLVGDVIDLWALKKRSYWPESHQAVLHELAKLAKNGTRVIYIPGNHDEDLRAFTQLPLLGLELHLQYDYTTHQGKKLLLVHGDQFDAAVKCGPLTTWFGDRAYDFLLWLNRKTNQQRRNFGFSYFSLASYLKQKSRKAAQAIARFEQAAIHEAKRRGYDGIVCGHIHVPRLRHEDGIIYMNDGDWVESCTALVEQRNGDLELLHWSDQTQQLAELPINHQAA